MVEIFLQKGMKVIQGKYLLVLFTQPPHSVVLERLQSSTQVVDIQKTFMQVVKFCLLAIRIRIFSCLVHN
jgi:hypothetical protein